jgi:hypothetical protein
METRLSAAQVRGEGSWEESLVRSPPVGGTSLGPYLYHSNLSIPHGGGSVMAMMNRSDSYGLRHASVKLGVPALFVCLCVLALSPSLHAATFTCDPTIETTAGLGVGAECLINAIAAANLEVMNPGPDEILLNPGDYVLTRVHNISNGSNGLPSITSHITIKNHLRPRSGQQNINLPVITRCTVVLPPAMPIPGCTAAGVVMRLFHVGSAGTLTLEGLVLSAGFAQGGGNAGRGGAIFVQQRPTPDVRPAGDIGNITLTNVQFSTNRADIEGGAIFIAGMGCCRQVIITDSVFFDNRSGMGGGIYWNNSQWCDTFPGCPTPNQRPLIVNTAFFESNQAAAVGGGLWTHTWFANGGVRLNDAPDEPLNFLAGDRGVFFLRNEAVTSSSYFCSVSPPPCPGP